jgi:DNA-binding MarR family transcriptional regulator/GNAT superfamily N-acetyltransferase
MEKAIASVRRFNRFFTQFVGALDNNFLDSGMTLVEARILFEVAHADSCFADEIQRSLNLDAGFVSRVLRRFEGRKWIRRSRIDGDGRRRSIRLTASGQRQFDQIDSRQRAVVERCLSHLDAGSRSRLVATLASAQDLLESTPVAGFTIRTFRPGDMGLIASRQAILYREQYGWNSNIEINVGEVTTNFLKNFKDSREQCWVAEVDGQMAGCVFLTDEGNGLSRLRLLYVEPEFQGRGIGAALVAACVAFARSVGYERMTLWTQSILKGARHIYASHGFRCVKEWDNLQFGVPLRSETWELELA